MKAFLASILLSAASLAQAASIPTNLEFPHVNGGAGAVYKLADHPNSVFVFEALGLSCGYCNDNAPAVDTFAAEYKDNARVQVLDLSLDRSASYQAEWVRRHNPNHPVLADTNWRVYNALSSQNAIPQVFVVDCHGQMLYNHVGTWDSSVKRALRASVAEGLASCAP